jgi:hypothetical protein
MSSGSTPLNRGEVLNYGVHSASLRGGTKITFGENNLWTHELNVVITGIVLPEVKWDRATSEYIVEKNGVICAVGVERLLPKPRGRRFTGWRPRRAG